MDSTTSLIRDVPWTKDDVLELLRLTYDDGTVDPDELDRVVRTALEHEGQSIPLGSSGVEIRVTPGVKKRLGLC